MKSFFTSIIMILFFSPGCKTTSNSRDESTTTPLNTQQTQELQSPSVNSNNAQTKQEPKELVPSPSIVAQEKLKDTSPSDHEIFEKDATNFKKIETIPLTDQSGKLVDSNDLGFLVFGDTGTGEVFQEAVSRGAQRICKKSRCDFAILLGDNIYPSGPKYIGDPQFQIKFEIPYSGLNFPFYVALGNHDQSSNKLGIGDAPQQSQISVDYSKASKKWVMPKQYFAALGKGIRLLVLDTTPMIHETRLGTALPGHERLSDEAKTQMAEWAEVMSQPLDRDSWNFVIGHHPYRSNGDHGNAGDFDPELPVNPWGKGKDFKDFLEKNFCGKTDIFFAGHVHSRQWLKSEKDPCEKTELVINGASAKTESIPGNQPTYFQKDTLGFIYVAIQGKTLTLTFYNQNGYVDYSRTITKQ